MRDTEIDIMNHRFSNDPPDYEWYFLTLAEAVRTFMQHLPEGGIQVRTLAQAEAMQDAMSTISQVLEAHDYVTEETEDDQP